MGLEPKELSRMLETAVDAARGTVKTSSKSVNPAHLQTATAVFFLDMTASLT